jgi:hypothetical protein
MYHALITSFDALRHRHAVIGTWQRRQREGLTAGQSVESGLEGRAVL